MESGSAVKLLSFNGTTSAQEGEDVDPAENYWTLVGATGVIVCTTPPVGIDNNRVLVQFDCDVLAYGLHCHNTVINSLWIKQSDLVEYDDIPDNVDFSGGVRGKYAVIFPKGSRKD